ncbi:MAG TPA: 3,4-dihydroxy-2-butanone-4-phosphate synthase [Solirubrobacterales bacterium]|jgi:3,4-dihydroxy 2-butanone 4-phosphate synthase/GTP cyclohydrolase II
MAGPFAQIDEALADLRAGRMVVVVGGEGTREEGDVVLAATAASPAAIVAMTRLAGGQVRLALDAERYEALGREAAAGEVVAGQRLPAVRASRQGLLSRRGPAEAAIDAARLAGFAPAALTATVHGADGAPSGLAELIQVAAEASLPLVSVDELLAYRRHHERLVEPVVETFLPTRHGDFQAIGYRLVAGEDHQVALTVGDLAGAEEVLVRVHPKCVTGDVFHSLMCRCGERLERSLATIAEAGRGALIYSLDDDDGVCAQVLADLGVASVRLLVDGTERVPRLGDYGIRVEAEVPLGAEVGRRPRAPECVGHR